MLFNFINLLLAIIPLISLALSSPIEGSLPTRELETPFERQDAFANKLLPRKDREPGDVLNRTLCFCQHGGFDDEQVDGHPTFFKTLSGTSILGFAFTSDYYNHRLDRDASTDGKAICVSQPATNGMVGFYNSCLDWKHLQQKYCTTWTYGVQPEGIEQKRWEYCYEFKGLNLHKPDPMAPLNRFSFDGGLRDVPLVEDYYGPKELVHDTCSKMCRDELGMVPFESKKGGDFSTITGYHHFDDICTKHMECDKGPKA
ncbi:MAG: hypothetical protein Q9212_003479 [Teloschistes hypoglaucus]